MLKLYVMGALRALWQRKLTKGIGILSLALGLAVFALLGHFVRYELSYERAWPGGEGVYRVLRQLTAVPNSTDGIYDQIGTVDLSRLAEDFADDIEVSALQYAPYLQFRDGDELHPSNVSFVEPAFTQLFGVEVLEGNLDLVLRSPGMIAISERFALRRLGGMVLGKRLIMEGRGEGSVEVEVGAIYRAPAGPTTQANVLDVLAPRQDAMLGVFQSFDRAWHNSSVLWLRLRPGSDLAAVQSRLATFADMYPDAGAAALPPGSRASDHRRYFLQPLHDIYLNPLTQAAQQSNRPLERVAIFGVIATLILLVACSNVISLGLAQALAQRREIGIRKASGALVGDVLLQTLGSALLSAMLAFVLAVALVEMLFPTYVALLALNTLPAPGWRDFLALGALAALTGVINAAYPAFVLAGVRPQQVLKDVGTSASPQGLWLRKGLLCFQFGFAVALLVGVFALYAQLQVQRRQPLGFEPEGLYVLPFMGYQMPANPQALQDALGNLPGVDGVSPLSRQPNIDMRSMNPRAMSTSQERERSVEVELMFVYPEEFQLLQVPLLAGRFFDVILDQAAVDPQQQARDPDEYRERVLLNRRAARALGFDAPEAAVGEIIYWSQQRNGEQVDLPHLIVGVVEDTRYGSMHRLPRAEMYVLFPLPSFSWLLVSYEPSVKDSIEAAIRRTWDEQTGLPYFVGRQATSIIESAFTAEQREGRLLLYSCVLCLLLACIGLYGLAAYTLQRSTKEVGLRRALGSSVAALLRLFLLRFSLPILAAMLLALPPAVYAVLQWRERFPYQLESIWLVPISLVAGLLVLVIALSTISVITVRAASARPVRSLRYE